MPTPTVRQIRTAIEVLKQLGQRVDEQAAHSIRQLPTSPLGTEYSDKVAIKATGEVSQIRIISRQLESWRDELVQQQKPSIAHHV